MVKHAFAGLSALALVAGVAGCGGGTSSTGSEGTKMTLEAADFVFKPGNLTIAKGTKVTLTINNTGSKEHNLTIEDGVDKKVNADVQAGKSATVTFTLTGDGSIPFHCEYHQNFKHVTNNSLGMVGTINGTGAPAGAASPASSGRTYQPGGVYGSP